MPNGQDPRKFVFKEIPDEEEEEQVTFKEIPLASQVDVPEIPFPEELRETLDPELLLAISQAQAAFAPDITSVLPEPFKETRPRGIFEKPGIITLDDVFSGEVEPLMPAASIAINNRATGFESFEAARISPLRGPIGRGVVGGTVRMAMNITEALIKKPTQTIAGFITAIPLLTFKGLQGFIEDTPLPDITVAGNEDALELVREKFAEIIGATPVVGGGRMSQEQMDEAHRGFSAVLAAAATHRILFLGLLKPASGFFKQVGVPAVEATRRSKLLAHQVAALGSLGTFGAVGGDPEEMEKNFVAFALASIPLGLAFHAFGAVGKATPKVNDGPSRAMVYQGERTARPFNQETTVVPEVRVEPIALLEKPREARLLEAPKEVRPEGQLPEAQIKRRAALRGAGDGQAGKVSENPYREGTGAFKAYDEAYNRAFDVEIAAEPDLVRPELPIEIEAEVNQGRMLRELDQRQAIADEVIAELEPTKPKAEPLVPDVLAARLDNYVQSNGDVTKIIIQNLETEPSGMVVVPGAETPARALTLAREIEGKDAIVAVHRRPDGMFDIAVGREGSPLDNSNNFKQFAEEGFFAGQKISVNGKDLIYVGKSGDQAFVRVPGDPRLIKVNLSDIRRPKDVSIKETITPAEEQLEGVIEPEEIKVFKALREEIHPLEPSTEARTFDEIRAIASTNGLELTRTASNTFTIRDRATGQELFKGATKEDAEAFINNIGQDGTVVFDGDIPIDTDVPGNVTPPPSPGLRVNEPFDFPSNTKVGTIVDLFQTLTPFITPFKDWSAATDNILGTRIFSEVYIKTQEPHGRSLARAIPRLRELQEIAKIAKDAKLSESDLEMVFDYIETMSAKELRGSHLKGQGPLKSRSMTPDELASADLLLELDVDPFRLYEYIRLRNQLFYAEARSLKTNIENLDPVVKKAVEDEIIDSKDMTPNEMAGVQIFDHIRAQDLNDLSLYVVTRLVEATRGGALSQADFAAKNNMTAAQIKIANEIVRLQDEVAAIPDIPIEDAQLIRGYMAHYSEHQTASPEGSVLNQGGVSRDMSFVNSMIRSGETNAYDRNPISVTARYIRNAFNAVEFNDAWNDAKNYVDKELGGQFGKEGSVASWIAKSYLNDIRGIPGAATKFTQQVADAFFKKMGWKMELNIRRDLVNTYLAMTNAAFMGARPGLAMRDLMQLSIFHYSRFGGAFGKRTMRALELATKLGSEGTKQLRDAGELPTIGIVEFETAKELEASAIGKTMKGLPAMTRKVAEAGLTMSGQRNAYEFGYKGVLLEARETALREITNFVDGKITKEQAYKRIGLDTYNLQTKKAFDAFITTGEYERAANFLGQQTAREIMGVYGRANHPWGWGTNLGRLMSHYGTWSSNALAFTLGGISRGSKKQRLAFASRFGMTQAALQGAGNAVGLNVHSWLVLPGLFFTGGPAVQTADLIITALTGYGRDKDAAKKRLMQLLPDFNLNTKLFPPSMNLDDPRLKDPRSMFIPGSYVVGDWLFAIKNADNPIEFFGRGFSIPLKKGRSWLDDF